MSLTTPDPCLRVPAELQRAARQHLRLQHAGEAPWLVPILFVSDRGGEQSELPDSVLHLAELQGQPPGVVLLPALEEQLRAQCLGLQERGWMALPPVYWPLAQSLSDMPGTAADPQFAFLAHAYAWDEREQPSAGAAPGVVRAIQALLTQSQAHPMPRRWRWPAQPGLVIAAEGAGRDVLQASSALCAPGAVLAVYAIDALPGLPAGPELPQVPSDWLPLRAHCVAELGALVRREITQRLLRQAATPMGQALQPWFAERVRTGMRTSAINERTS